jgi:hypothetical protein
MAAHAYPYGAGFRFLAVMGDAASGKIVRLERAFEPEESEAEVDDIAAEILEECHALGIKTPRDE